MLLGISAAALAGASLTASASQLAAARANNYVVENKCKHPVRALLHMVDAERGWRTYGWYDLEPGAKSQPHTTPNRYVYFLFQKADGSALADSRTDGTRNIRVGAKVHKMNRINLGKSYRSFTHTVCR